MKMELLVIKPRDGFMDIKPWEIEASLMSLFQFLVFCFICLFVIDILYIVVACIKKQVF